MKLNKLNAMVIALGLVMVSQASAVTYTVITQPDYAGPPSGILAGPTYRFGSGYTDVGVGEDNETEAIYVGTYASPTRPTPPANMTIGGLPVFGTVNNQSWDFEAYSWGDDGKLRLVGGYDFRTAGFEGTKAGDLFIKFVPKGSTPAFPVAPFDPTAPGTGNIKNDYEYNLAIRWSTGTAPLSAAYMALNKDTWLQSVTYDAFGANPDRVITFSGTALPTPTYTTVVDANAVTGSTIAGAHVVSQSSNKTHYVLTLDMNWLGSYLNGLGLRKDETDLYLSWTMDCGNDMGKGFVPAGGYLTPDGGLTLSLLGLGMAVTGLINRRRMTH